MFLFKCSQFKSLLQQFWTHITYVLARILQRQRLHPSMACRWTFYPRNTECSVAYWPKFEDRVLEVIWSKKMSNKLEVDSTPLSSYALVKRAGTAVPAFTLPRLCCVVLQCSLVKMSNTLTNEEYADMNLVYWNSGAAVVDYPPRKTLENLHRTLKDTGSFPRENAGREQRRGDVVLVAVQRSSTTSMRRILRTTGVARTRVWRF
jgi:hypothetical protein